MSALTIESTTNTEIRWDKEKGKRQLRVIAKIVNGSVEQISLVERTRDSHSRYILMHDCNELDLLLEGITEVKQAIEESMK